MDPITVIDGAVSVVLARHMHDSHVPLPAHVPVKLRALVDRLLAKKPDDRIQTAGEVRRILDDVRESIGATSLAYISLEGLQASTSRPESEFCRACLTRDYPTAIPREAAKLQFEPV